MSRSRLCICGHRNEEFTSPPNEQRALARSLAPERMSRLTLSSRSFVGSFGRSVEFRGLTSRRLSSPFGRTSIRCRADSMSMQSKRRPRRGCQLSVIYGPGPSNPSLTILQTWRGRKGEKQKEQKENDRTRVPLPTLGLRQEAPKIHRATKIAATRRCRRRRRRRKRTRSRVKETRHEVDQYDLSGNRLVFQRSRASVSRRALSPFCLFHSAPTRAEIRLRIA